MAVYTYRFNVIENVTSVSRNIQQSFDRMNGSAKRFRDIVNKVPNPLNKVKGAMSGVGGAIAGAFAVDRLVQFGGEVVNTLSEFEKYEAVLTNTFGDNSAAKQVLSDITDFATKTPFQVDELTNSFVKLANRGFVPNMEQMTMLGDLAASQGKDFDQLAEAILDAETAEFERLKEFGIRASKEGNRVMLSFKGIQKEVENSPEQIRAAILALSQEAPGVTGAMAAISETTGGMISNLIDVWTQLQLAIGKAFEPLLKQFLPQAIAFVGRLTEWVKNNQEAIQRWVPRILMVVGAFGALVGVGLTLSVVSTALGAIGAAIGALFSPIGLLVAAIAAVGVAVYAIIKNWETVKQWMIAFGNWMWENHPFKWMIDLIDKVFPQFKSKLKDLWNGIKETFKQAINWLYEKFIKPVAGWFGRIFKNLNFDAPGVNFTQPGGEGDGGGDPGLYDRLQAGAGGMGAGKSKGSEGGRGGTSAAAGTISGGTGGAGKNITINIGKLIEQLVIQTNNLQESRDKIKQEVTRALIDAVNDVNYAN